MKCEATLERTNYSASTQLAEREREREKVGSESQLLWYHSKTDASLSKQYCMYCICICWTLALSIHDFDL